MQIMDCLTVSKVESVDKTLKVHFSCSGRLKRFFSEDVFLVEYDRSIEGVPVGVLVIPFLATCAPVVWANNGLIKVEEVDLSFFDSLQKVKKTLRVFFPELVWGGRIVADRFFDAEVDHFQSMMLFSGGVDSLATYIRHHMEKPILVGVHGADVCFDNYRGWKSVEERMQSFADSTDSELRIVRSNFRNVINNFSIYAHFNNIAYSWYGEVMHGLALLGLCAPIAYKEKAGKLYIAATHTKFFSKPWGSHPDIDNNVAWTGTKVFHDSYDISRQEKLGIIADYIKKGHSLVIRSCWQSIKGDNCNVCEKCSRTIVGLEVVGINQNKVGYNVTKETFPLIRKNLENYNWEIDDDVAFMWKDIQHHARLKQDFLHPEAKTLITWLLKVNFDSVALNSKKRNKYFLRKRISYCKNFPLILQYFFYEVLKKIESVLF